MNELIPTNQVDLSAVAAFALQTVAKSSARIYGQTYRLWIDWNAQTGGDPLDLRPAQVIAFIEGQDTTKPTRQRQLAALRKLAQMRYILAPTDDAKRQLEALSFIKAQGDPERGQERTRKALTPAEADRVLRVWDAKTNAAKRNRALVGLLALSGMRRAELAALRWQDIDFDNGIVLIRHGKGDQERSAPIAGEFALEALRTWYAGQGGSRVYIFCAVNKGDHLGADKPITGTDVYRIIQATAAIAGVDFKPHDLRRTFITEALSTGTPIQTVQAAAGHARGETTLKYAQAVSAREARKALKLRYGD